MAEVSCYLSVVSGQGRADHDPSSFGFRHSFVIGYLVIRHSPRSPHMSPDNDLQAVERLHEAYQQIARELAKVIV
ncbi:MAG: hypothetical protein MUF25_25275, partial [Pirellulaceae bacterium]|nr:hypothetical protein [Pirellulaceae bacterium]